MNRRVFLKGVAGATVAAPFLSSVHEQQVGAQAAAADAPKRMVIFFTHNGCITTRWFPKKENGTLEAADLAGGTLEPLTPYVSKLLMPRGFRSMNEYFKGQSIDPHDQAMGSKLTCAQIDQANSRYATATSLDHIIAKQINPGAASPLVLSVGASSKSIKEVLSFSQPITPYPANVNPQTVYSQLTGLFKEDGGTPGTPSSEGDYRVMRGQSALDLVREDLKRYQALNMSVSDKNRIQHWMDLLRDTETGGSGGTGGTGGVTSPGVCSQTVAEAPPFSITPEGLAAGSPTGKITAGVFGGGASAEGDKNLATSFTLGGDLMLNMIALSMICDMNRSIIMLYPGYVIFNWDGMQHTHDHHGLSHRTGDLSVGGACKVEGVIDMIHAIDKWYAGKYAKLVGLLDSIQEGDKTLLDNTATMWLPELSDGNNHNQNNLPIVIAGSAGGYFKQGAVVNVEGKDIGQGHSEDSCANGGQIGNTGSTGGNVPINKLYVGLMNALGVKDEKTGGEVTQFGEFDGMSATGGITNPGAVESLRAGA